MNTIDKYGTKRKMNKERSEINMKRRNKIYWNRFYWTLMLVCLIIGCLSFAIYNPPVNTFNVLSFTALFLLACFATTQAKKSFKQEVRL